ncbi:MAG: hypothetical protein R2764_17840 [Bacteroidales bacterium]
MFIPIKKGYLNLNDTVKYVGMLVCKECHYNIYATFRRTGMGMSFDTASREKSAAVIREDSVLYDPISTFGYQPFCDGDTLRVMSLELIKVLKFIQEPKK